MEWRNHVAVVTGGSRGIGRATARLLAQCGAAVCVNNAMHADAAGALVAEITTAGGRAIAVEGDGETVFRHACKLGFEGIVSKRKVSPYRSGRAPIAQSTSKPLMRFIILAVRAANLSPSPRTPDKSRSLDSRVAQEIAAQAEFGSAKRFAAPRSTCR
jgi:NAD(P)-dependent dehydrogenase (short-subunit alcohol dehydrogenase family)